jgi:predicted esterase
MLSIMERDILKGGGTDYYRYLEDPGFADIRAEPRFDELIELAKQNALRENEAKAVTLEEGYWYDWELESEHKLPIVNLSFQYDDQFFTIRAEVQDTHFRDGERAWRYGDGFLINFLTPKDYGDPYANEIYMYGFSMENGRPVAVLVEKDGTAHLRNLSGFRPQIKVDEVAGRAEYLIQIPWSRLYPFHPLMDERAGINVRYRSQDDDGKLKTLIYVADWATEWMDVRRYAPLYFVPSDRSRLQMTGALETRLVSKGPANLELCVWAPEALSAVGSIVLEDDETGQTLVEWPFEQDLDAGKSTISREIELPEAAGLYHLAVQINDSLHWEENLYRYDPEALARLGAGIQELALAASGANARNSANALEYRLTALESRIAGFGERDNPQEIEQDLKEVTSLYETFFEHGSIYVKDGYLLSAFRSPKDDTLQPFSVHLPANYDPSRRYDLVVGLHGSGVDEVGFVEWQATHTFAGRDVIILGPRGRHLSDWWTGTSGDDVAELVELAHSVFNVSRTYCYGFSMGGYGVWRMGFLHPELFDGAIVVAGYPHPPWPPENTKENDMRTYIGQAKELPFLVIHGPNDPQLSIEATDRFVSKLEKEGYDVVYHRPEGGGHTNMDVTSIVNEWLDERFGQTRRVSGGEK